MVTERWEELARRIINYDQRILDCNISSGTDGAVLADVVKQELRGMVEGYSHTGSGMGSTWGLTMINILRRLDKERSKLNYVNVSREKYNAIFFPAVASSGEEVIIGLLLEKTVDPDTIYTNVLKLL